MNLADIGSLAEAEKEIAALNKRLAALSDAETEIQGLKADLEESRAETAKLEEKISEMDDELDTLAAKVEELELDGDVAKVVDDFLDCCERTGPLRYVVPQTDRASRAIVALHDVVGSRP